MTPTPTTMQGSLFATCALPGCGNSVAGWGDICADCVAAFSGYLQLAAEDQPALTEHDLAERDRAVADAQAAAAAEPEMLAVRVATHLQPDAAGLGVRRLPRRAR